VAKITARHTGILSMCLYGGKSHSEQVRDLKNGVHLIVACPGRLRDHIEKKTIDLSGIDTVVLDEADQLMDMGFLPHVKEAMEETKNRKQTLLFSATMSDEVKLLTEEFLVDAETINHHANRPKAIIQEVFCPISYELRYPFLRFILKHHKARACLIFTRTKDEARVLGAALLEDKYKVAILEGDMTTHQRKKALTALKEKNINILVATDIASRGLDIPHVTHIINFNPPLESDSYVHRMGRTARHEKGGTAITIYLKTNDEFSEEEDMKELLKYLGKDLVPTKYKEFNYALKLDKKSLRLI
jgi:ATP-dependent RNA helicase RhlE